MLNDFNRFSLISDILPFIRNYTSKLFVIKYGGSAMQSDLLQSNVINDISFLHFLGIKIVLVHGGGPFVSSWLSKLDIKSEFENGVRLTDSKMMEVVEMVLSGKVNKNLVSLFGKNDILSVGLSGKDANLSFASPFFSNSNNLVGRVNSVNSHILRLLLSNNYIPVISSISSGLDQNTYNINADTFAGSIAESLLADKLILLTDTLGIMKDMNDSSSLIKDLKIDDILNLKENSIISGGMIPKVDSCVKALKSGVKSTHIIDGRISHSLLLELFTLERIGSRIVC